MSAHKSQIRSGDPRDINSSPKKKLKNCFLSVNDITSFFFFSSRKRHTRLQGDWSSDVCSSDLAPAGKNTKLSPVFPISAEPLLSLNSIAAVVSVLDRKSVV